MTFLYYARSIYLLSFRYLLPKDVTANTRSFTFNIVLVWKFGVMKMWNLSSSGY